MGIGENNHSERDEVKFGCTIVGMAALSKKPRPAAKDDIRGGIASSGEKVRPACPLMATIAAKSGK